MQNGRPREALAAGATSCGRRPLSAPAHSSRPRSSPWMRRTPRHTPAQHLSHPDARARPRAPSEFPRHGDSPRHRRPAARPGNGQPGNRSHRANPHRRTPRSFRRGWAGRHSSDEAETRAAGSRTRARWPSHTGPGPRFTASPQSAIDATGHLTRPRSPACRSSPSYGQNHTPPGLLVERLTVVRAHLRQLGACSHR